MLSTGRSGAIPTITKTTRPWVTFRGQQLDDPEAAVEELPEALSQQPVRRHLNLTPRRGPRCYRGPRGG
jgi:hypothetical protein